MHKKPKPELIDGENPRWTSEQIANALPASEMRPQIFGAQIAEEMLKPRGRPRASYHKERIKIRLAHDVVTHFKALGDGWQTRIDAALKDWVRPHSAV